MQNKIIIAILSLFIIVDVILVFLTLTITPLKLKRNYFIFEYGSDIPTKVEDYVNGNQSVLESVKLDLSQVTPEVGIYNASIEYFGETYSFEIEIRDTVKPKVQLKQIEFDITLGQTIRADSLIEKIEDSSSTTVYFYDEDTKELSQSKSYNIAGSYIEKIIVEDAHGNQSASLRVKIVVNDNRDEKI